jgi:dTDP-L-rhamnose 4-epimerase
MGYEVRIFDNLEPRVHPKGKPSWLPREAEFVYGDVRDKSTLAGALEGVQLIFHQAAYQDYMPDFSKFFHTNTTGTALIHEVIVEKKMDVQKVVVASSQAVYGEGQYECRNAKCKVGKGSTIQPKSRTIEQLEKEEWELKCPFCGAKMESLPLLEEYANPYNQYAISKYAQELVAIRLGKLYGIPTTAFRYSITQGPRQSLYNQYSGICRIFSLRLLHDLPPIIYEDGQQKRDYVHIDDVVDANMVVMEREETNYEVYNVGSGRTTTVLDYAERLSAILGKNITPLIQGEFRLGDNRHSISSIEKLKKLGWIPKKSLDDIFNDYIGWVRSMGDLSTYFSEAEKTMRSLGVVRSIKKTRMTS